VAKTKPFGMIYSTGTPSNPAFFIRWWEGKTRKKKSGFTRKKDASDALAEIRIGLGDGTIAARRGASISFHTVATDWLRVHSAPNLRSHADNAETYDLHLRPFFGDCPMRTITPMRIMEFKAHLQTKLTPHPGRPNSPPKGMMDSSANTVLQKLRTILNFAVLQGHLVQSPLWKMKKGTYLIKIPHKDLEPPISQKWQVRQLLDHIKAMPGTAATAYPFFAILIYTGMRRGEALGLRWADVHFDFRLITISRSYGGPTKSAKDRKIPLPPELAEVLAEYRERAGKTKTDLVLGKPGTGAMYSKSSKFERVLQRALTALHMPKMTVHKLRHVYASFFVMSGGQLFTLQKVLGHSSSDITSKTYAHLAPSFLADEGSRVSFPVSSEATRSRPDSTVVTLPTALTKNKKAK
jgi:integrase